MVSSLFLELSYFKKWRILRDQMFDLFPSDYLTIIHLLFSSFPFTSRDSSAINTCDRVNPAKRGWQWNPRLWCSTSTQTRQSAEERKKEKKKKAAWRARLHHVSQLFSVLFNPTPPHPTRLSPCLSVPLRCVLFVPSLPLSMSLSLMCFGVRYPRVLARCCSNPKAGSGGQLKRRVAVCDISHCYYSRLTSPHCLKPPKL